MSIFASQTSKTLPIPFDSPHTVTVRKLTGKEYEEAQTAHRTGVLVGRDRLWNENFRRIVQDGVAKATEVAAALKDPLTGFDRFALVRSGVTGWSYEQPLDAVSDLDDDAVEFFALEVLKLTKPYLFVTVEEAQKNDSRPSTAH